MREPGEGQAVGGRAELSVTRGAEAGEGELGEREGPLEHRPFSRLVPRLRRLGPRDLPRAGAVRLRTGRPDSGHPRLPQHVRAEASKYVR